MKPENVIDINEELVRWLRCARVFEPPLISSTSPRDWVRRATISGLLILAYALVIYALWRNTDWFTARRIALLEGFWQAGYPPRYAALLRPSSPSFHHSPGQT
jgi:hypothetical protein